MKTSNPVHSKKFNKLILASKNPISQQGKSMLTILAFLFISGAFHHLPGQQLPDTMAMNETPGQRGLFDDEEMLVLTIRGNIKSLFKERKKDKPGYQHLNLSYQHTNSDLVSIPLKIKPRGHFRRSRANCYYPPLLLNFSKKKTPENSIFYGQDKLKLVTPCKGDEYVVREYLAYKIYNLVTENSFKARLVRIVFDDTEKGKKTDSMLGIILEDADQMAARNGAVIVKKNRVRPQHTDRGFFLKMSVFEYLIGNTDWSIQYRHNIKLLASDSTARLIPVPYDFDHAGIVSAPYARPAEALQLKSVRERRYRGYCIDLMEEFEPVFNTYNELKKEIYQVYTDCPHLDKKYRKFISEFLDEFYKTINDPKASAKAFRYPCKKDGTGNVVIKGLKGR